MTAEKKQAFTRRISQANATMLVVITYEIALENLEEATQADPKSEEFTRAVTKARDCVYSLQTALNFEHALSRNLLALYGFAMRELTRAASTKEAEHLEGVRVVLTGLHQAFMEVAARDDSAALMENTQNVYAGITYGRKDVTENAEVAGNRGFLA